MISRTAYSVISVTTPAPTVRPPSRIANRNSFSIATGVIRSIVIVTLSPGITISHPACNVATPDANVVPNYNSNRDPLKTDNCRTPAHLAQRHTSCCDTAYHADPRRYPSDVSQ